MLRPACYIAPLASLALAACVLLPPTVPPPTPTPTPSATATPEPPIVPVRTTHGRAVVRVDLCGFAPEPPLDYYALSTLLQQALPEGRGPVGMPALELSVRGLTSDLCQRPPCTADSMGLVARWSASPKHDAGQPDEHQHVGEGISYWNRLPLGPACAFDVEVAWEPGTIRVSTPVASALLKRGAEAVDLGWYGDGVGRPPWGIGWARTPWTGQQHGAEVALVRWVVGAQSTESPRGGALGVSFPSAPLRSEI